METQPRVADRADQTGFEIAPAAHVVEHLLADRIFEHGVDREIAPLGVAASVGEGDGLRVPTVEIRAVLPEGGHFELV